MRPFALRGAGSSLGAQHFFLLPLDPTFGEQAENCSWKTMMDHIMTQFFFICNHNLEMDL